MEILAVRHLTFTYPGEKTPALRDLSLSVSEGDFLVLCGFSGCGKSTLLRQWKPALAPHGERSGEVLFRGEPVRTLSERDAAACIGFVMQSPENQIVTDKVWHELAFGLESLGIGSSEIRRRVAEMASFFGIQDWLHRDTAGLSGGQKQTLNLASVMVMRPQVLILDEPTAQLDPIAALDFLTALERINRELGVTVVLTDHRLEEALPRANRAAVMEEGGVLLCEGSPAEVGAFLKDHAHGMFEAMPSAMRIWGGLPSSCACPVSPSEGRLFLKEYRREHPEAVRPFPQAVSGLPEPELKPETDFETGLSVKEVWFRYGKDLPDVLKDFSLEARSGEIVCLLGGNGTGKSTALRLIAALNKPYRGEILVRGRAALLPQDPQLLFVRKTVKEDLEDVLAKQDLSREETERRVERVLALCRLSAVKDRHPYDLSGGEQQRAALAKVLLTEPKVLLLDEPTKGMDARLKAELASVLRKLRDGGACVLLVSHDIDFCAEYADRCALVFDGGIVCEDAPRAFFSGNSFYTTAAAHMAGDFLPGAVTAKDVVAAMKGEPFVPKTDNQDARPEQEREHAQAPEQAHAPDAGLPIWRKVGAILSALSTLFVMLYAAKTGNFREITGENGPASLDPHRLLLYGALLFLLFLAAAFLWQKAPKTAADRLPPGKRQRRLPKRTAVSVLLILLAVPLTLLAGWFFFGGKQYYLIAFVILLECMLPFFLVFEGRRPKARELVTVAVLCALAVAGRAAFFMLPQFKPVLAIAILAGASLGAETGFLVGAVSMLVSNMLFSQGPWTPWQMFAAGMIGFLAGILFRRGFLRRSRASLCLFGAICTVVIYGGMTNPVSALIWAGETLNRKILLSFYVSGFPMDCIHAAATAIFLWFLSGPLLGKLERVKIKYGLLE